MISGESIGLYKVPWRYKRDEVSKWLERKAVLQDMIYVKDKTLVFIGLSTLVIIISLPTLLASLGYSWFDQAKVDPTSMTVMLLVVYGGLVSAAKAALYVDWSWYDMVRLRAPIHNVSIHSAVELSRILSVVMYIMGSEVIDNMLHCFSEQGTCMTSSEKDRTYSSGNRRIF